MSSLFSKPKAPAAPKPVRMPVESDPDVLAAGARTTANMARRSGRQSTIMTEGLMSTTGSSGQKLGA